MKAWVAAVAPLLATVPLAVVAVVGSSAEPAVSAKTVVISDISFLPETVTVEAGETVIWTNTGQYDHTVTAEGGEFNSGTISPGTSYTLQLTTVGNYGYYCAIDGAVHSGIVTVQAPATSPPTPVQTAPPPPVQTAPPTNAPAPSSSTAAGPGTPTETPSGSLTPGPRTPRPTGETFTPRATPERSSPPTTDPIDFDEGGGGASSMPFVVGGIIAALALAGVGFYAYRVYAGRGSEPPDPPWRRRF